MKDDKKSPWDTLLAKSLYLRCKKIQEEKTLYNDIQRIADSLDAEERAVEASKLNEDQSDENCEYCTISHSDWEPIISKTEFYIDSTFMDVAIIKNENKFYLSIVDDGAITHRFLLKHCPMCGRDLRKEVKDV